MLLNLLVGISLAHYNYSELSMYYLTHSAQDIKVLLHNDKKNENENKMKETEGMGQGKKGKTQSIGKIT